MRNLIFDPTDVTPSVNFDFDNGRMEISGRSLPEDSFAYYKPLIDWLQSYSKKTAEVTETIFKLEYFNTSSTVFILKILKGIALLKQGGKSVTVKWYYKRDDDDMCEAGKEFGILAHIPIELIPY